MSTSSLPAPAPSTVDRDLIDVMEGVFADYRRAHRPAAPGEPLELDRALWQQLDSLGLVRLTGSERSGGSGGGWQESVELLTAAVRHGVRLPLAEHDLLACWLLEAAGQPIDDAVRTVHIVPGPAQAAEVAPWASVSDRVVVLWQAGEDYRLIDVDSAQLTITPGVNLIGEPRDTVVVDTARWSGHFVKSELITELKRKAALLRAIQVCAALDCAVAMSIEHSASRTQFGRPLTKFQAIQNLVADAAAEAALARAATESALATAIETGWTSAHLEFQIAVARSCTGHAASVVTRNAHQVHGAMGTTHEHRLHEMTRAALAWRSENGSVYFWDRKVAAAAAGAGSNQLWALITGTDR
ncbi:acyl-CoA dehydrogenase family protein [Mycolicibacterium sp. lyk4-40-TYG-92]|uniref:acyl-CoA dehydrogenase family protein n=1 Tax=Mycolicibacterium sp. lyk4-40-TYG-92 TaxID=3040295 RepID=UPI00254F0D6F|nr:acyl-CoA dehydrogenase family protein [Mycolicibacterium sp. lyk4-40-TYG-92]